MVHTTGRVADAPRGNWVDRYAPAGVRPYLQLARADRPIGGWLLMWPCWWSAGLAATAAGRAYPDLWHLALFLVGAHVMRGAGCVWNDFLDRKIDAEVERTRSRPLPSGRVSAKAALAFMVALALTGLVVLLQLNAFSIGLGIASLGIVAVYPLMKRVTSWPQAVLGLAFAWGGLMGWAVERGALAAPAFALYAAAIVWTIGYDTIYAVQDARDDPAAGVKSTARLFGARVREGVSILYLLAVVAAALALRLAGAGVLSWIGLSAFALHLVWQTRKLATPDAPTALMLFRSNRDAGLLLFAGLAADALARSV